MKPVCFIWSFHEDILGLYSFLYYISDVDDVRSHENKLGWTITIYLFSECKILVGYNYILALILTVKWGSRWGAKFGKGLMLSLEYITYK